MTGLARKDCNDYQGIIDDVWPYCSPLTFGLRGAKPRSGGASQSAKRVIF